MQINGIHYHVETYGSGDPLVLLHGFSGSSANWSAQVAAFADQLRVVTVDLPGHGATDSPPNPDRYAMPAVAADLIAIFDALKLARVHVLGYSMGGRLALYTALTYPDRIARLILESASPGLKTDAERTARVASDQALADRIEQGGIAAFATFWTHLPLFASQSPDLRQRLHAQRRANNPQGLANSLRGMGTGAQPPLWQRLSELAAPTLLIAGEHDAKFVAINREMAARIPRATFEIIGGAGHTVHAEQPARYNHLVRQFLSSEVFLGG